MTEISKFEKFEHIQKYLRQLLNIVMTENDRHIQEIQENVENILLSMSKKCEKLRKRLFEYYFSLKYQPLVRIIHHSLGN